MKDTFNTYTWDAYGDLASVNGATATYDAFGRMAENASGSHQFVYSPGGQHPLAVMSGQTPLDVYVPLPGGAVAVYNSSGTLSQYNHGDWIGSARLFSTPARAAIPAMSYAPFGEGYAGGQQRIQFTGAGNAWTVADNENQSGSLEDFTFRRYSPVQGRWISPDPAGMGAADPTNPQSWNRYAYVMNNPLSNIDPLGLQDCTMDGVDATCDMVFATIQAGGANGAFPRNCNMVACVTFAGLVPLQQNDNGQFGGCGSSDFSVFCITFAPMPVDSDSWAWAFTKSFFAFAGGPGNVPTCAGQALRHMGETLNSFTPSPATAAEFAAPVAQAMAVNQGIAQTQAGIDAYVAARGLTVPLRSSIVRAMAAEGAEGAVAAGARANFAVQTLAVDYAAVNSTITTAGEARSGQCAAALPVF